MSLIPFSTYLIKKHGKVFDFFNQKMVLKGFQNNT